jgi:hypothetical protein
MTDRKQPHPQRCETCGHYQTRFEYGNKKICTLIEEKAPSSYQIGIPFYIDIVGCASHSSASGPVPEKCEYPEDCRRPADRPEARIARQLADTLEYLESLRQQEEP